MLEYKIILPEYDNDGEPLLDIHEGLQEKLAHTFGGFTMVSAQGAWVNARGDCDKEDVIIYTIAVESDHFDKLSPAIISPIIWFRDYARTLCRVARQDCVYIAKGYIAEIIKAD